MAGFDNTPPASEFRRPTSWGRTRQPKNIAGAHGSTVANRGDDNIVNDLADLNAGTTANRAGRGYATENQRYLHVTCEAGASVSAIYVYSHAFDRWSELVDSDGNTLTVAASEHKIFTIAGADKVHFWLSGTVYAAGSTF